MFPAIGAGLGYFAHRYLQPEANARAVDRIATYGPRIAGELAVEYAAGEVGRRVGNFALHGVRNAPGWIPGLTTAFAKGLSWRSRDLVRRFGRKTFGMNQQPVRGPYVPQQRFARRFAYRSHALDRYRSGSRNVFFERKGDWKRQFISKG